MSDLPEKNQCDSEFLAYIDFAHPWHGNRAHRGHCWRYSRSTRAKRVDPRPSLRITPAFATSSIRGSRRYGRPMYLGQLGALYWPARGTGQLRRLESWGLGARDSVVSRMEVMIRYFNEWAYQIIHRSNTFNLFRSIKSQNCQRVLVERRRQTQLIPLLPGTILPCLYLKSPFSFIIQTFVQPHTCSAFVSTNIAS